MIDIGPYSSLIHIVPPPARTTPVVDGDMVVAVDREDRGNQKARPQSSGSMPVVGGAVSVGQPAAARRIARFVQRDRSAICHIELVLRRRWPR